MPNTNIAIYLTDEEYIKYAEHKKVINGKVREYVKKELGVEQK